MSTNERNGRKKIDIKSLWKQGKIQKGSRITYDVVWNIVLFFVIIGVIGLFFAGGVGAGYFASLVKDQPIKSKEEMTQNIYNYSETSKMYFANEQMIGKVQSDLYREVVELEEISPHIIHALIATEDVNFNKHSGVVPKAVMRAVFQEVTNAPIKTGGSTLTQQLVKNQILTNEVSFERKAKEMLLALRVERFFEKDEILEAYLNIVPFGRNANGQNIAGVQTAARGIFGVNASELSIAQAAYIAGLPQAPFGYTPFYNDGSVKPPEELEAGIDRMHEVLERMYEAGYINQAEYEKAMAFKINEETLVDPTPTGNVQYPFLAPEIQERASKILKYQLAEKDGYTKEELQADPELNEEYSILADRELSTGGYKIHTTIEKEVYDVMQEAKNAYQNYGPTKSITTTNEETGEQVTKPLPVQVGSVVMENSTGRILGFIGGRDFDIAEVNHATDTDREVGSTIKPLLVYGPSFDLGAAQPGSVIADVPYNYPGTNDDVNNYSGGYKGFVSARYALAWSYNVPAVKQYAEIRNQNPVKNYLQQMGVDIYDEDFYTNYSMALGAFEMTVAENTNAYATFGNMGTFVDAFMIEKIETVDGDVVYEHETVKQKVFSPQAAYLMVDVMRDVLKYGTANGVRSQLIYPGVDWAGKTGTSQSYKDSWFVATNPNVTVGIWTGYDKGATLYKYGYSQRTQGIWADVVNAVSQVRPELMVPDNNFQSPGGLVTRSYCATSGLLASDLCASVGLARSDIYDARFAPTKVDDSLTGGDFVKVKGQLVIAGPNTPGEFIINGGGVTLSPEFLKENGYTSPAELRHLLPNSGAWANVALPSASSIGSTVSSIDNDGQPPQAPGSVTANGSTISWSASPSSDVVGYRVYRAAAPGGSYSLIGSTAGTSLSFSGSEGVYAVRAVDYFGAQSGLSSPFTVGTPGEPKPAEEEPTPPEEPTNENGGSTEPQTPPAEEGTDEQPENTDDESTPPSDQGTENDNSSTPPSTDDGEPAPPSDEGSGSEDGQDSSGDGTTQSPDATE